MTSMHSPEWPRLLPALIGINALVVLGLVYVLLQYRKSAFRWKGQAQYWYDAARHKSPPIKDPRKVLRDIFAPSTERDVERAREWREHRALRGVDHHTYHFAEGEIPSIWAREVLDLTVGGSERAGE